MKHNIETVSDLEQPLGQVHGLKLAKQIAHLMPDAVVFVVDKNRRIRFWSSGAEKQLGFTSAELVGEICLSGNRCVQCMKGCSLSEKGKIEGYTLNLHTSGGEEVTFKKYARSFVDINGIFDGGLEVLILQTPKPANPYNIDHSFTIFQGLIGNDPAMRNVFQMVRRVASTNIPVLVRGESGTGKELVAKAIHDNSSRKNKPFVAINCASLNASLLESELFGHIKGAFSGAIREHIGLFERANGGTLFLDEIAELPIELQATLLRVLETGEFIPVGGERSVSVDVRIVTATNRALREEVTKGRFRQDLLYRLRVIPIFIPPLRERRDDIPYLARHLLKQYFEGNETPLISSEAMDILISYDWPGNVRELKNAMYYALVMHDGGEINPMHLPNELKTSRPIMTLMQSQALDVQKKIDVKSIALALEQCNGNLSEASIKLGISRTTLWRYRKKYFS